MTPTHTPSVPPTTPALAPTETPTPIFNPCQTNTPMSEELPPVIVTDDELATVDLSNSEDRDRKDERMLVIRWSTTNADYIDFHVKLNRIVA